MAIVGAVGITIAIMAAPDAVKARWAFFSETMSPSSTHSEIGYRAWDYPEKNLLSIFDQPNWQTGNGTGVASLGGQYVTRLVGARPLNVGAESGYGTLIIEFGILGPILWTLWTVSLFFSAWRVVRKLKQTALFPIGFAIFWYAFMLLGPFTFYGLNGYQNYLNCGYLWLIVGMLFRFPGLLKDEQARQANEQLLEQQRQHQEEDLELQGVTLSHADAGP
jgi:hypothetical protein